MGTPPDDPDDLEVPISRKSFNVEPAAGVTAPDPFSRLGALLDDVVGHEVGEHRPAPRKYGVWLLLSIGSSSK